MHALPGRSAHRFCGAGREHSFVELARFLCSGLSPSGVQVARTAFRLFPKKIREKVQEENSAYRRDGQWRKGVVFLDEFPVVHSGFTFTYRTSVIAASGDVFA